MIPTRCKSCTYRIDQNGDIVCVICGYNTHSGVFQAAPQASINVAAGSIPPRGMVKYGRNSSTSSPQAPDLAKTQPIRNDGERCLHCGKRTKELVLLNSITRYCPDCEGSGKKSLDTATSTGVRSKNADDWSDFELVLSDIKIFAKQHKSLAKAKDCWLKTKLKEKK